jgi:glycosyltransferase EpsH
MTSRRRPHARPEGTVIEPKMTFIVPVYNVEKYLGKCVSSILNQSLSDFELLLINDGSTDTSLEVCNQLASTESRIRVFSQSNCGQAMARNRGLGLARGKYISFIDPDDWIHPEMAEKLVAVMQASVADFVSFRMAFVAENGTTKRVMAPFSCRELVAGEILNHALVDQDVYTSCCNKVYLRSFLSANSIVFPDVRAYEDTFFSRVMSAHASKCVFVNDVFYFVLIRAGSTSRKITASNFDLAAKVVAMEKAALRIDQRGTHQKDLFDAHVVKFFCHLIFAAAIRVTSRRVFSECIAVTERIGYPAKRRENGVLRHLNWKNRWMVKMSGSPAALWLLAPILKYAKLGTH